MSIGATVRRLREAKDWSPAELARRSGVNQSVVSRLESGDSEPTEGTLAKVANALGESVEVVRTAAIQLRQEVSVGFAHCLWAAPLIACVTQREWYNKRFAVTSYSVEDGTKPAWHRTNETDPREPINAGPRFVQVLRDEDYRVLTAPPVTSQSGFRCYTARDLLTLLNQGTIHAMVAASDVFTESIRAPKLLRCAQLTTSFGSCSLHLVCGAQLSAKIPEQLDALEGPDITLRKFRDILYDLRGRAHGDPEHAGPLHVLYSPRTVGERHLSHFEVLSSSEAEAPYIPTPVHFGDWTHLRSTVLERFRREGALLILGWEPHLSWISKVIKTEDEGARSVALDLMGVLRPDRFQFLSFDVLLGRASLILRDPVLRESFETFLSAVEGCCADVASIQDLPPLHGQQRAQVQAIAEYLNLRKDDCYSALMELDFELKYYPEWLEALRSGFHRG